MASEENKSSAVRGLALPDFLGIGAQKSGTTWLHSNLKAHSQTFLPEPKEVHFFDTHFERGREWYGRVFEPGEGKIKGEITPAYGILPPEKIGYIQSLIPRVKLIFLMRNPIDRAWSHAMMSLCWQVNRAYETIAPEEFIAHFRSAGNVSRCDYEATLRNWLGQFERSSLFLGFFEDIALRPEALLTDVFAHLGLSQIGSWKGFPVREVIYPGRSLPMPSEYRRVLTDLHGERIRRMSEFVGNRAQRWLEEAGA